MGTKISLGLMSTNLFSSSFNIFKEASAGLNVEFECCIIMYFYQVTIYPAVTMLIDEKKYFKYPLLYIFLYFTSVEITASLSLVKVID